MKQGQGVVISPIRLTSSLSWNGFVVNVSHMKAAVVLSFTPFLRSVEYHPVREKGVETSAE